MAVPVLIRTLGTGTASGAGGSPTVPPSTITSFGMSVASPHTAAADVTVLVWVQVTGTATAPTLADSRGNTYTLDRSQSGAASGGPNVWAGVFRSTDGTKLQAGDTLTVTAAASTAFYGGSIVAQEWHNLLVATTPADVGASSNNSNALTTSPTSGANTTTQADELLVGAHALHFTGNPAPTFTRSAGWSVVTNDLTPAVGTTQLWMPRLYGSYQVQSATGSRQHDGTLDTSAYVVSLFQAYKAAAPGAAGVGVARGTCVPAFTAAGVGVARGTITPTFFGSAAGVGVARGTATPTLTIRASAAGVGVARGSYSRLHSLWNDLGLLIRRVNAFGTLAANNLPGMLNNIVANQQDKPAIEGIYALFQGLESSFTGFRQAFGQLADVRLLDQDWVLTPLGLTDSAGVDDVLDALGLWMVANQVTVDRSTVTVGTVVPGSANRGNGTVLVTTTLDGVTPPGQGFPAHSFYDGVASELAVPSETMTLECVADHDGDGVPAGAEEFAWRGGVAGEELTWEAEGSGDGPGVTAAGGSTLPLNGDFESFSSDTPSGWDVDSGTAGTHVLAGSATDAYRG